jgi:hypothetical protein
MEGTHNIAHVLTYGGPEKNLISSQNKNKNVQVEGMVHFDICHALL